MTDVTQRFRQPRQSRWSSCLRLRVHDQDANEVGEVVTRPVSIHEGFRRADISSKRGTSKELRSMNDQRSVQRTCFRLTAERVNRVCLDERDLTV